MKKLLALVLALFVGFVFARLIFALLSLTLSVALTFIQMVLFIILVLIFATPLYFIFNKSFFKNK